MDVASLRRYFKSHGSSDTVKGELRNPHIESPVPEQVKLGAKASSVLIGVVDKPQPEVVVTRRPLHIRFGGHICFPGGLLEAADTDEVHTALREAEEEIGLDPEDAEVLGMLPYYFTQAGYRIRPVVALLPPDVELSANPNEVDEILKISFERMFRKDAYSMTWHSSRRGHLSYEETGLRIAGPTVSIMVGLIETLALSVARISADPGL